MCFITKGIDIPYFLCYNIINYIYVTICLELRNIQDIILKNAGYIFKDLFVF